MSVASAVARVVACSSLRLTENASRARDQNHVLLETEHVPAKILVIIVHATVHLVQFVDLPVNVRHFGIRRHGHGEVIQILVLHDQAALASIAQQTVAIVPIARDPIIPSDPLVQLATDDDRQNVANVPSHTVGRGKIHARRVSFAEAQVYRGTRGQRYAVKSFVRIEATLTELGAVTIVQHVPTNQRVVETRRIRLTMQHEILRGQHRHPANVDRTLVEQPEKSFTFKPVWRMRPLAERFFSLVL